LKEALGALNLKTGGTLRERAQRLWLTKDTPLAQIDRKHFQKGLAPAATKTPAELAKERAAAKASAYLEAKVCALQASYPVDSSEGYLCCLWSTIITLFLTESRTFDLSRRLEVKVTNQKHFQKGLGPAATQTPAELAKAPTHLVYTGSGVQAQSS
jgi:hypothetical protein